MGDGPSRDRVVTPELGDLSARLHRSRPVAAAAAKAELTLKSDALQRLQAELRQRRASIDPSVIASLRGGTS